METPYDKPELAGPARLAADGRTVLRRYRVLAVVYAPDYQQAVSNVNAASIYFDAARVLADNEVPASMFRDGR